MTVKSARMGIFLLVTAAAAFLTCGVSADYADIFGNAVALWNFNQTLEDANPPYSHGMAIDKRQEESKIGYTTSSVPMGRGIPGAVYTPGADGYAVEIAQQRYINLGLGSENQLCIKGPFTIFARVRPNLAVRANTIMSKSGSYGLRISSVMGRVEEKYGTLSSSLQFSIISQDSSSASVTVPVDINIELFRNANAFIQVADPQWMDIAAVYEPGKRIELYLDGKLAGKYDDAVPGRLNCLPERPVTIGGGLTAEGKPASEFYGEIELMAFWDRPLAAKEISALSVMSQNL